MKIDRRSLLLTAFALPAGCAIHSLPPMETTALPPSGGVLSPRTPAVGQSWTYRQLNFFNSGVLASIRESVSLVGTAIDISRQRIDGTALPAERHAAWGQLLRDPAWDYPMNLEAPVPLWPATLTGGARASVQTRYLMDGGSFRYWVQVSAAVRGWERVTVAAGTFDTVRIERLLRLQHHDHLRSDTVRRDSLWLAPEVGRWVARETSGEYFNEGDKRFLQAPSREDHVRWELTEWE